LLTTAIACHATLGVPMKNTSQLLLDAPTLALSSDDPSRHPKLFPFGDPGGLTICINFVGDSICELAAA